MVDLRNEKITYKIREHSLQKLPYILVVGDKEMAAGAVAVRARGNRDLGVMSLEAFAQKIAGDITDKSVVCVNLTPIAVCPACIARLVATACGKYFEGLNHRY